jgi:hypothetical protein
VIVIWQNSGPEWASGRPRDTLLSVLGLLGGTGGTQSKIQEAAEPMEEAVFGFLNVWVMGKGG